MTLHDGGFPVGNWLWRLAWKCAFPRNIMADSETQKLERVQNFFKRIVQKVEGGGGLGGFPDGPFRETQ